MNCLPAKAVWQFTVASYNHAGGDAYMDTWMDGWIDGWMGCEASPAPPPRRQGCCIENTKSDFLCKSRHFRGF